jgi:hypothetical protein
VAATLPITAPLVVAATRSFARFTRKLVERLDCFAATSATLPITAPLVVTAARSFARFALDDRAVGCNDAGLRRTNERGGRDCACRKNEFDACHESLLE